MRRQVIEATAFTIVTAALFVILALAVNSVYPAY